MFVPQQASVLHTHCFSIHARSCPPRVAEVTVALGFGVPVGSDDSGMQPPAPGSSAVWCIASTLQAAFPPWVVPVGFCVHHPALGEGSPMSCELGTRVQSTGLVPLRPPGQLAELAALRGGRCLQTSSRCHGSAGLVGDGWEMGALVCG